MWDHFKRVKEDPKKVTGFYAFAGVAAAGFVQPWNIKPFSDVPK